jgi:hypothetical protein
MKYPNIFLDTDDWSMTKGQWCVRIDEGSSYDGYTLEEAAALVREMTEEDLKNDESNID